MLLENQEQEHLNGLVDHDTWMKKFVGNRPFNIQRVLDIKVPKMEIENFSKNVNLEETEFFRVFLKAFNDIYETEIEIDDLLYSKSNFKAFSYFIMYCGMKGHIVIREDNLMGEFIQAFERLQEKYEQNIPSMEKYYDEIIRAVYYPKGLTKKDKGVREEMYLFKQAYSLMKREFRKQIRENNKSVFEHLTGTMEIVIRELPNPNLNKIVIALLHDIVELFPEYAPIIRRIYGDYIADGIDALSKKKFETYMAAEEMDEYTTTQDDERKGELGKIGKDRRNEDYFGHLDALNDDYLDAKFADRIHNLRDMNNVSRKKIHRKIQETEIYFLHVAQKRNPTAHQLIMIEIEKLKKKLETGEKIFNQVSPFLDSVFESIKADGIDVSPYELDHICYKVETEEKYQELKEVSKLFGELLSEAQINGREISTFKLKKPITYNDRSILCLELPAPKKGSAQKEGFDHVEFAIQGDLNEFMEKYASINFDTKGMGKNINPDISKKYDGCEVKFHQNTLEYVIKNEQA